MALQSTVPDFHEAFLDFLRGLAAPGASPEASVYAPFRDHMGGFYILTYLRLLVGAGMPQPQRFLLPPPRASPCPGLPGATRAGGDLLALRPRTRAPLRHGQAREGGEGGRTGRGVGATPVPLPSCVLQFCETEVEAVHRDADQVQVVALTAALKVRQSRGWQGAALAPFLVPPKIRPTG